MKLRHLRKIFLSSLAAASLHTGMADATLAGVKTSGMAAATTAYPIDSFAAAYNPAGIALLKSRIDLGVTWTQTYGRASFDGFPNYSNSIWLAAAGGLNPVNLNAVQSNGANNIGSFNGIVTADAYFPELGITKHWCPERFQGDLQFATSLIFYNNNYLKTAYKPAIGTYKNNGFHFFGTTPTEFELLQETGALCFAARFCRMHSFGVAINYNVQRLKVEGFENYATSTFSSSPKNVTNRGYNYSNGVGVTLGYLFEYKCYKLGASWQPQTKMSKLKKYQGFVSDHGKLDLPERYNLGFSYRYMNCLTAALDYEYIKWTCIPQFGQRPFPALKLGSPKQRKYLLGASHGAGFGYRNQYIFRFGVEYDFSRCLTLRVGFRHANRPIKRSSTFYNLLTLDCMENTVTLGTTLKINPCNEINLFCGIGTTKKIVGKNSVPAQMPVNSNPTFPINVAPTSALKAPVRSNGEVTLRERAYSLGASWGKTF